MSDDPRFVQRVVLVRSKKGRVSGRRRWHYRQMGGNNRVLASSQRFSDLTEAEDSAMKMAKQLQVPLVNAETGGVTRAFERS